MSQHDDASLIARIADGDRDAMTALYRAHEASVFRFIISKMNDPHEAADILHDVFIEVWRSAGRFEGRSKVRTWIFSMAWRKVVDRMRKSGRMTLMEEPPDTADEAPSAEACLAAGQEAEHVRHCLGTLKADHQMAVTLAFWQDMSYGDIAEIAGVPEGTIKTRIFHAKKLLLRCLSALDAGRPVT
jgi:RNA polymerase sigma factor (sigma-70 family)